jgi:hypothetical protein
MDIPSPEETAKILLRILVVDLVVRPGQIFPIHALVAKARGRDIHADDIDSGFSYAQTEGWVEKAASLVMWRLTEAGFAAVTDVKPNTAAAPEPITAKQSTVDSQGQSGGTTAHTINIYHAPESSREPGKKDWWKRTEVIASVVLVALALLGWFGYEHAPWVHNKPNAEQPVTNSPPTSAPVVEKQSTVTSQNQSGGITAESVTINSAPSTAPVQITAPTLVLQFVHPKAPALIIVNTSSIVAREIKWQIALWNNSNPEQDTPLHIPAASAFDWIAAHGKGGPISLFGDIQDSGDLKQGDEIYGSLSVSCPDCARGRTYLIDIKWGEGGWYSEVKKLTTGQLEIPAQFSRDVRALYLAEIVRKVRPSARIPITD